MPNHYEFVPRDGKKMTYEFHIGSGMGPHHLSHIVRKE